jgi:predicted GNAT family acetyltransferase
MNYADKKLRIDAASSRIELELEGGTAFIEYKLSGHTLFLIHTEVPPELEGKGVGGAIVLKTFQYAKENGYEIVPLCPFVQTYLERHKEWKAIVSADAGRFLDKL